MTIFDVIALFGVMTMLATIPSASVLLVVTRSATSGIASGIAVAAGIVLGDLTFIILTLLGLSVVAQTLGGLFLVIKYAGAAYLIWIGIALLRSDNQSTMTEKTNHEARSILASFMAGLLLTLGDIKAIVFYISLFPAFLDINALMLSDITLIVIITIIAVGGTKVAYALSARKVVKLSRGAINTRIAKKVAGGCMIGAGSCVLVKS